MMKCLKCGYENNKDSKYCSKCGSKLKRIVNIKYLLLTLPVMGLLVFSANYIEINNYITPTTSLNLTSFNYRQHTYFSELTYIALIILISATILIFFKIKSNPNKFDKIVGFIFRIVCDFSTILESLLTAYLITLCTHLSIVPLLILSVIACVIGGLAIYDFLCKEDNKFSSLFWQKIRGITVASLIVLLIFSGFSFIETNIMGKRSYADQIQYNREKKVESAIDKIDRIFSNCELKINDEKAVDYTDCNLHLVNTDGDNKDNLYYGLDSFRTNKAEQSFEVYMDSDAIYKYYPYAITKYNAKRIIGNSEDDSLYITIKMKLNGKMTIEIKPEYGDNQEFNLKTIDGKPALNGTLGLADGYYEPQSIFTVVD